jgi:hypothetical protein
MCSTLSRTPASWSARHYTSYEGLLEGLHTPNAVCPHCRRPVFYFAAPQGCAEYFNGLGPGWARHPCADGGRLKRVIQRLQADHQKAGPALAEPKGAQWVPFWVQSILRIPEYRHLQQVSGVLARDPLTLYVVDGRLDPHAPFYVWQDRNQWYLNTLIGSSDRLVKRVFLAQAPVTTGA